jgi:PAS domain S-box-containing protein
MSRRELVEHLARQGYYGPGDPQHLAEERLANAALDELARESSLNDGRIIETRAFGLPDGGYIFINTDVTAQRQAERATNELAAIVSSSDASILRLSPDGIITAWNDGAARLYGYSAEEAVGQPFGLLAGAGVQTAEQAVVWQRVSSGEQVSQITGERTHKDGHSFSITLSMSPIFDDDGVVVGISGVAHDITDRLAAEKALAEQRDELAQLNGQQNRLFSIIAHDLRTPFNSLLGFSEILSEHAATLSPKEISDYAQTMYDAAQQANALLENLLEWSRLRMGGLHCVPRPFDVAPAIEKALVFSAPNGDAKGVAVSYLHHLQGSLLTALADPDMVETILRNLIGNAVKFTQAGGSVTVQADRAGQMIAITVKDDGVGIAPERLAKLFQFETGASTAGTNGEAGTGLGLQLCKELVELQGGAIKVESTAGQGSTFTITLPSAI